MSSESSLKIRLFGLQFDALSLRGAAQKIIALSLANRQQLIVPVNVDVLMLAKADEELMSICQNADILLADGMPLVWVSRLIGTPLPERVTGADLLPETCALAAAAGVRVFFLGGKPGAAEETAKRFRALYPGLEVAGTACPRFGFEDDVVESGAIVNAITRANTNLLFIGVGAPKQEKWVARHLSNMGVGAVLCVGASLDFSAGYVKRAPRVIGVIGLEWAWRLFREPQRLWRRYLLRDTRFIGMAFHRVIDVWLLGLGRHLKRR